MSCWKRFTWMVSKGGHLCTTGKLLVQGYAVELMNSFAFMDRFVVTCNQHNTYLQDVVLSHETHETCCATGHVPVLTDQKP